jgi:hypothetical protein
MFRMAISLLTFHEKEMLTLDFGGITYSPAARLLQCWLRAHVLALSQAS